MAAVLEVIAKDKNADEFQEDSAAFLADLEMKTARGDFDFHHRKRGNTGPSCAAASFDPQRKSEAWIETFRGLQF